jgi:hypothetical protein
VSGPARTLCIDHSFHCEQQVGNTLRFVDYCRAGGDERRRIGARTKQRGRIVERAVRKAARSSLRADERAWRG